MFDQPELEAYLRNTAQSHPNVTAYIGYEMTQFSSDPKQVAIQALGDEGEITLAAHYLFACDGANSAVRKALGIGWRDLGYDQDWLVVDVEMIKTHTLPNEVLQVCDPDRIHTFVATKDPYRRWEFQLNDGETAAHMLEHQTIHRLLETWTPRDTYRVRRAAVYQFHAAIAEQWQQGRIFLAGDAAHQTPPFLGQGMNSGMRDVINLAWKLPLVLNGQCAPSLLDSYQAERDDHAHDLVSWAVDMGHLMQHVAATEAAARAGEEPPQMQQTSRKSGYGQGREQPPIRSGVVLSKQVSNAGATGYLLPQPVVRDPEGKEVRFDDLLGANFALLTHGSVSMNQKSAALIAALQIQLLDVSTLEMVHGKLPELLQTGEALLIRPDRLVFGHTDADVSLDSLFTHLAELLGCSR
jgi:3-(3-hydroxy-phenyl)propionate hydroxylase